MYAGCREGGEDGTDGRVYVSGSSNDTGHLKAGIFKSVWVDIMSVYGPVIQRYEQEHLLEQTAEGYLCLTEHGIDVSNQILADFLIDTES